eukprot:3017490-Pyramimonas_sp.AAC.2
MSAVAAGCYYARQTLAPYVRPLVAKMYPELASGPSNASDAQAEALALAMRQQSAQVKRNLYRNQKSRHVIYIEIYIESKRSLISKSETSAQ